MPNTGPEAAAEVVHVAVGVVFDGAGQVLIALRGEDRHQGGLWEFPGGKVEPGEDAREALIRELREEVGLAVAAAQCEALLQVRHDYGDKEVLLDVWRVRVGAERAVGAEGQMVRWVPAEQLEQFAFPAANAPILATLMDRT